MANTMLSDVIVPSVYETYQAVPNPELTAFFDSGVAVRVQALEGDLSQGGLTVTLPFWKDLDPTVEPNYSTDDATQVAVPQKITADYQVARTAQINQGWSAADLVTELAGSDPLQQIRNRTATYWRRAFQRRLLAVVGGIYAANVAQNASDMVIDISIADGNAATSANIFSRNTFINLAMTAGDQYAQFDTMAVHSVVLANMIKQDLVTYIPASEGKLAVPTYLGKRVIVDDNMPVVAGGTSGFKYTSVLFGQGAIGWAQGTPRVPTEVIRAPAQGNGGGVEQLWERKTILFHPFGYRFTSTTVTGQSPTLANLKLAANWSRVLVRKQVPMAFLVTNG